VFEFGYQYFEISAQFTGSGAPPAVGIVDANFESFDAGAFLGVAMAITEVGGLRPLSGSFALQDSAAAAARSGAVGSADPRQLGLIGSSSSATARASLCCFSPLMWF
jgi:hypothetical protein